MSEVKLIEVRDGGRQRGSQDTDEREARCLSTSTSRRERERCMYVSSLLLCIDEKPMHVDINSTNAHKRKSSKKTATRTTVLHHVCLCFFSSSPPFLLCLCACCCIHLFSLFTFSVFDSHPFFWDTYIHACVLSLWRRILFLSPPRNVFRYV